MTLQDIYGDEWPSEDELIWNFVGQMDFENEDFKVQVRPIDQYVSQQFIRSFNKYVTPEQKALVDTYKEDPSLADSTIVIVAGTKIINGNHRLMAMYLAGVKKIKIVDLEE